MLRLSVVFFLCLGCLGACIQIGTSHPCGVAKNGEKIGCHPNFVCYRGWCVPKDWGGIKRDGKNDEFYGGLERSAESFRDGVVRDGGAGVEHAKDREKRSEHNMDRATEKGIESKPEQVKPENPVDRGCTNACPLGETQPCYPSAVGCDAKGSCKGLCAQGKQFCYSKDGCAVWSECWDVVTPKAEECDGKDNDCDGQVDEDLKRPCYGGAVGTEGKGICRAGDQVCVGGVWGNCVGEVIPAAEKCDKLDNNCDGQVDEGCSCQPNDKQSCGSSDVGECKKGQQVCDASGKWGACVGEVGSKVEACNNKDDDCDGKIDNGLKQSCYGGAAGTEGKGICKAGEKICNAGVWGSCIGDIVPVIEKCDGLDNDCDGQIDESDPILDKGCTSTGLGYCKPGLWKCVNKKMACTIVRQPQKEVCNGVDDDCDGIVDNAGCFVWATMVGNSSNNEGRHVVVDSGGNVFVTGVFGGTASFGTQTLTSKGGSDVFVAKLDNNGKFLWATSAGGPSDDEGFGLSVDVNGNVYLIGQFEGTSKFGGTTLTSKGSPDVFIAKLDSSGKFLWVISASVAPGTDSRFVLKLDGLGNLYVTGYFFGVSNFGTFKLISKGDSDVFVAKLDNNGKFLWATSAGGLSGDVGFSLSVDSSGSVFVSGGFGGIANFGSFVLTSKGFSDVFVAKLDNSGKFLWATSAGGPSGDSGTNLGVDKIGNIYVVGGFNGTANFGSFVLTSKGAADVFVAKLDSSGKFLWATSAGSPLFDLGWGLAIDSRGGVFVSGGFGGITNFGSFVLTSKGFSDIFVAKLDNSGKFLWATAAGGPSDDIAAGLVVDLSGNIYVTGLFSGTANFGTLTLTAKGSTDIFVTKYVP